MNLNWLSIVVLLILAGYTIYGYQRGMLRVLFSLFSMILTILFVSWATPHISSFIKENTQVYQKIAEACEKNIQEKVQTQMGEEAEQKEGLLEQYGVSLPETFENSFFQKAQEGADTILESSGTYAAMAESIAKFLIDGISFFLALIVCTIFLRFLGGILNIVSKIPVLKGINRVLGLAAGFLQGLILVWLFFYFIAICRIFPFGQELYRYVEDSAYLKLLYDNNLILYFITIFL